MKTRLTAFFLLLAILTTTAGSAFANETAPSIRIDSYPAFDWSLTAGTFDFDDAANARFEPSTSGAADELWYESPFYWVSGSRRRVGRNWRRPVENAPSVRRFNVERDGEIVVSGRGRKLHIDPSTDGVCVSVRRGDVEIWNAEIDCGDEVGVERRNDDRAEAGLNPTGAFDREFTKSYYSLCRDKNEFWGDDGRDPKRLENALVPRFGGRNTIQVAEPGGKYGALGSRPTKRVREAGCGVDLTDEEIRTLAAWIDLNAIFYGVYDAEDQERQRRGEAVPIPEIQ